MQKNNWPILRFLGAFLLMSVVALSPLSAVAHAPKGEAYTKEMGDLNAGMKLLWAEHMEWTYAAVTAFLTNPAAFDASAARLLANQKAIGDAIKPFYGEAAGDALTQLLEEHIFAAVEVVQQAKNNNKRKLKKATAAAYDNAQDIADFLAGANAYWPKEAARDMMKGHIDTTLVYAVALISGEYEEGIAEYTAAQEHMQELADILTIGLIAAFPEKFSH